MKTYDLNYFDRGMFTTFIPNTPAGENAWRVMAEETGNAVVLSMHSKSVISQLRRAGYSVAKAKPSHESIDEILAELGI